MKILTSEITTAEVVDSPTPLAPPIVVTPHEQLTMAMITPNTCDLIRALMISHGLNALLAESSTMLELTPYTLSASRALDAIPTVKQRMVRTGTAIAQARTLGVTK